MKKNKMVLIDWSDTAMIHGWQCLDDMPDAGVANCKTVCFLIDENVDAFIVCSSMSDQGLIMERCTIPKGCVKSIKKLRIK